MMLLEVLLEANAQPDILDYRGKTALDHAEESGSHELVELLRGPCGSGAL